MHFKRFSLTGLGAIMPLLMLMLLGTVALDTPHAAKATTLPAVTPWAVVLCKTSDHPEEPHPFQYYSDLFTSSGAGKSGLYDYWNTVSYGKLSLSSSVVKGWVTIPETLSSAEAEGGNAAAARCFQQAIATGIFTASQLSFYYGLIAVFNNSSALLVDLGHSDSSNYTIYPGQTKPYPLIVLDELYLSESLIIYYMDHWAYGGDVPENLGGYASAFGGSGPSLPAPQRDKFGWLDVSRVFKSCQYCVQAPNFTLTGLDQAGTSGYLMGKLSSCDITCGVYTVELRLKRGWDSGISFDGVKIYQFHPDGTYSQVTSPNAYPGDLLWTAGQTFTDSNANLYIKIQSIDSTTGVANIQFGAVRADSGGGGGGDDNGGGSSGGPGCCHNT